MPRRLVLHFAAVLVFFLAVLPGARAETIRFGILPVLDTLPLQVAAEEGLFAAHGLDVELVPFASALERDVAMQTGRLDGYFGDMIATLLLIKAGAPIKAVTVSWVSSPGQPMFGLVDAPGAGAPDERTVAISKSTIIEYLLDRMIAADLLPPGGYQRIEIKKIPIRLQMLLSGEIDAAVLPEPLVSLAAARGGTVRATDETLGMVLTVLCLDEDALDRAEAFNAAVGEAVALIGSHPKRYRELMVATCRIPKPLAPGFPVYDYPAPRLPSPGEVSRVQQWMLDKGLIQELVPYGRVAAVEALP